MLEFGLCGRKIYFLELNWINFPIVLLFRLAGIYVYYLTLSSFWKKENRILWLNNKGISWLNYQDLTIKRSASFMVKANELSEHVRLCLSQTSIFGHLKKQFDFPEYAELSFNSLVVKNFSLRILLLAELLKFAELIESKSTRKSR